MRALLGCFLVLSLAVSPAIAGTNGSDDSAKATSSTSTSTNASSNSSAAAQPAATSTPAATTAAKPAASSMETELGELRDQMDSQARQIQEQNDLLKAEQEKMKALEEQLKTANSSNESLSASPAAAPTSGSSSNVAVASASVPAASSSSSQPAPAPQVKGGAADVPPGPLSFRIGGAEFTPGGFVDVMDVFRSTDNGGQLGTGFGGVLYPTAGNYPLYGSTEDRFSLQNSRISLRVDGNLAGGKAVGYLETDFLGNAASTIFVTSNSDTLRLRLYFLDWTRGKFEFLGGQDWSMLTSNRTGIGFMPADIFYTNDVDTNYQLGLIWQRTAQVRFIYHPTKTIAAGFSLENPEQFIGSGLVTLPAGVSSTFANQFDTNGGSGGSTNTPNLVPDIVAKIAFDPMIGELHEHVEVAGIARTFRVNTFTAATATVPQSSVNMKTEGGGIAVNSNFEIFKNFHILENAFWSDGDGRDIIGLIPDFVVRPLLPATAGGIPAYTLSPIHAGSFIAGFEYTMNKTQFYGYTSGAYASKNYVAVGGTNCLATGVTCPGYGQPVVAGSVSTAEGDNRYMQEQTLGLVQTFWRNPQYGAVQLMIQASYVARQPWYVVPASPAIAHLGMAYIDFRYTLP